MTSRLHVQPGSGRESVWERPRPPRLGETDKRIKFVFGRLMLSYTTRAKRVLEATHPLVYYIPSEDVRMEYVRFTERVSFCERWGVAPYYGIEADERMERRAVWFYPDPTPLFSSLKDYVAFYLLLMDAHCWVDGEKVRTQEGDLYGGWITTKIGGPFKGGPGTWSW